MPSEKLVKDIMRPLDQCCFIKEDKSVRKAFQLMAAAGKKGKPLCLIVVGEEPPEIEMIKGFVTPKELVFGSTTRFLKGAEKSGPIFWEGQLEAECLDGMNKRVREIMAPVKAYVRQNEMLMEAVFLLHRYQEGFLPVIGEEEVAGTIHISDILTHITKLVPGKQGAPQGRHVSCDT